MPFCFRLNDSEIERQHFKDQDTYSDKSDKDNDHDHEESDNDGLGKSEESDSDTSERQDDSFIDPEPIDILKETTYVEESHEELGEVRKMGFCCCHHLHCRRACFVLFPVFQRKQLALVNLETCIRSIFYRMACCYSRYEYFLYNE